MKALTSIITALLLFAWAVCGGNPDKKVIAWVGSQKIDAQDLKKRFEREGAIYSQDLLQSPEGETAIKKTLLQSLIEERLLLQEADRLKITLTDAEEKGIEDLFPEGKRGLKLDRSQWLTLQQNKKRIENLIAQEITPKIPVTDREIAGYYRKHPERFREPNRVRCRQITTQKREKGEKILALLNRGENFAALAKEYSESPDREAGGDLGWIAAGEAPKIFETACFTLAKGQTSAIVASEYGFHLFRVTDKKPGHLLTLKEATPKIKELLMEGKKPDQLRIWLDRLYAQTKIEVDEKALERVSLAVEEP